jgi:hypothetical protein
MPEDYFVGRFPNSYAIDDYCAHCWLSGKLKIHQFQWSNGVIKPERNGRGDVLGCGILLSPKNELSIFFTGNGILMGQSSVPL